MRALFALGSATRKVRQASLNLFKRCFIVWRAEPALTVNIRGAPQCKHITMADHHKKHHGIATAPWFGPGSISKNPHRVMLVTPIIPTSATAPRRIRAECSCRPTIQEKAPHRLDDGRRPAFTRLDLSGTVMTISKNKLYGSVLRRFFRCQEHGDMPMSLLQVRQ